MFNPASAFIKACKGIYDLVMFFINRGSQIMTLVQSIIGSMAAVVSGNVGALASAVEGTLAKGILVAIGFLASLLGLGGISGKIQDIMKKVRKPVDTAIDWVVEKGKAASRKLRPEKDKGKDDKTTNNDDKEGSHADLEDSEVGKVIHFSADGEGHRIWIADSSGALEVMVASQIKTLPERLAEWKEIVNSLDAEKDKEKIAEANQLLSQAKGLGSQTKQQANTAKKEIEEAEKTPTEQNTKEAEIADTKVENQEQQLVPLLVKLFNLLKIGSSSTWRKVAFVSPSDVNAEEGNYGSWLRKKLSGIEPQILSNDQDTRNVAINKIRGKDKKWEVFQGAIYAPFIEDNREALEQLKEEASTTKYLLSLERGGTFLADQISKNSEGIVSQSIPKRELSEQEAKELETNTGNYKVQQQEDLKSAIDNLMDGNTEQEITISIAETFVGGGSTNQLLKTIEEINKSGKYPNLKFKLLLLRQTAHTNNTNEKEGVVRRITSVNKTEIIISPVKYILGEDVNFQIAKSSPDSKKPVTVFKGAEDNLIVYEIVPKDKTTSRDILIKLVEGKYDGLLPGVF